MTDRERADGTWGEAVRRDTDQVERASIELKRGSTSSTTQIIIDLCKTPNLLATPGKFAVGPHLEPHGTTTLTQLH